MKRHQPRFSACYLPLVLRWVAVCCLAGMLWGADSTCFGQDPPEAQRLASEAGNLQNGKQFDLAAELWDEFLEKYPKSELASKARHYSGICHMKTGALDKAVTRFREVVQLHRETPGFPLLEDALLNLGWCEFSLAGAEPDQAPTRYDAAIASFRELLERFPQGRHCDQALYFQAESLYLQGKVNDSIPLYQKMVATYPESQLRPNGLYALAIALDELGQREGAIESFDRFLKDHPDHELAADVAMRRAESLLRTALDAEAAGKPVAELWQVPLTAFATLATTEGFEQADRATYQQAFCEAKIGKTAEAAARYASVAERFPNSPIVADARIAAARTYLQLDQAKQARAIVEPLLDVAGPKRGEAAHWWAKAANKMDDAAAIRDRLASLVPALTDDPFAAMVAMDRADAFFGDDSTRGQARDLYAAIVEAYPKSSVAPQALYNTAFEDFEAQRYDTTLAAVERFRRDYASDSFLPDMLALEAECRLARGESAQAADRYAELIPKYPQHPDAERWSLRRGLALYAAKRYDDVVSLLSAIATWSRPDWQAEAKYLVGAARFQKGDAAGAVTDLQAAIDPASGWSRVDSALIVLARALAKTERAAEARTTLNSLLERYPASEGVTEARFRLGELAEAAGEVAAAREQYRAVVQDADDPFVPYALVADAWLAYEAEAWDEAVAGFRKAIDAHAGHVVVPEATLGLGMTLRRAERHGEAIAVLEPAVKADIDPQRRSDLKFEYALALLGEKRYEDAERVLSELIASDPTWTRADQVLYQYAWAAKYRGDTATSVERFASLAKAFPKGTLAAEAAFHQGEAAYEAGRWDEADTFYQQALAGEASPSIADNARYKRGWARFKQGQFTEAEAIFVELDQRAPAGLVDQTKFMIAESRFEAKDYERAYPTYLDALERIEASDVTGDAIKQLARLHAAQAANQLKKWDEAFDFAEGFLERWPDSTAVAEAWFEVGEANRGSGKPTEAMEAYEQAAALGAPRLAARARCMVGEVHFAAENYDEAVKQFRRVMFGFDASAPAEVKLWQAFAGYEAGRCAQVQIAGAQGAVREERLKQAIEAFRYVVDNHPQDRLAPEARKQLDKLVKPNP